MDLVLSVIDHDMQLVAYGMFGCNPDGSWFSYPHIMDAMQWGSVEINQK